MCVMKGKENRNFITFQELFHYFYSCWISGYTLLGLNLQKEKSDLKQMGVEVPAVNQLVTWCKKYQDNIRLFLENSLREIGVNPGDDINYEAFKFWISKNPQNIQLIYQSKFLTIATNLICLDDVEFMEIR